MLQRQGKGCHEGTSAPPQKKVTFYGPVMTAKGEKLRLVGTKTAPRKRATFSSLTSTAKGMTLKPTNHKKSKSVVGEQNKLHSKTTVIGIPTMTRLNCNHLRPKCQCSNPSGRKTLSKVKHKLTVSDTPRQILTSTRSLPRGELDGRKSYKDNSNSISILDANWRPGLDIFSEDNIERKLVNQNSESDIHKESGENNDENKENSKKKVQFAEKMNMHSGARKKIDVPQNGSNSDTSKGMNSSQRSSNSNDEHLQSQPNNHSIQPESSAKVIDPPVAPSSSYHTQRRNVFSDNDSLTDTQGQEALKDYCTLCELPDHHSIRTFSNHRDDEYQSGHYTDLKYSSLYGNEDPCLLCRRYGRQHYYTDDGDQHKYNTDYSHTLTNINKHIRHSALHKTRSPLCRKLSTPTLYSDKEEEPVFTRRIPYEPRTELVKNLKQKLEAGYRNHEYEYLPRRSNFRRWRSWDAEDSDHNSHLLNYSKTWDHSPHHKCIHRYLQNERLFLEPTVMDIEGRSVCVECGEPQPTDPDQDPFLYHITLGGMNGGGLGQNKDKKAWTYQPKIGFTSKKADKYNTYQRIKKSSGDTSKHIYTKLNKNINNILPSGPGYFLHPWSPSKLRYCADPHVKRHPSKSMALVDHIV